MKKIFFISLCCVALLSMQTQGVQDEEIDVMSSATTPANELSIPEIGDYTGYNGRSFVANWGAVEGATKYLLNVYSDGDLIEKWAELNNTTLPADFYTNVYLNEERQTFCLEKSGDFLEVSLPEGQFKSLRMQAKQYDNEGVTDENSAIFRVELYNTGGERIIYGDGNANYFSTNSTLDIFEAFGMVIPEIHTAVISLVTTDERNVGKLSVEAIGYSYNDANYLYYNKEVSGATKFKVLGIDAGLTYFYNVRASDGSNTSRKSADKCVDGFLKPVAKAATGVDATCYTANWGETAKAWDYDVYNYLVETRTGAFDSPIFSDNFDKAAIGSLDDPLSVSSLDDYTAQKGWQGNKLCIAKGMIGASQGSNVAPPRNYNYVQTPVLDLSAADGVYTIHAKFRTQGKAETLNVYNTANIIVDENGKQSLNIHAVEIPESGEWEETWTMDDGRADMRLSFEPKNFNTFFIDEITITQVVDGETVVYTLVDQQNVEGGSTTQCTFTDLTPGASYAYRLTAHRYDYYGYEQTSDFSDYQLVALPEQSAGITTVENTIDGAIYDLQGRRHTSAAGLHFIIQNRRKILQK